MKARHLIEGEKIFGYDWEQIKAGQQGGSATERLKMAMSNVIRASMEFLQKKLKAELNWIGPKSTPWKIFDLF